MKYEPQKIFTENLGDKLTFEALDKLHSMT